MQRLPESYKVPWDREAVRSSDPGRQEQYFKKLVRYLKDKFTDVAHKHNINISEDTETLQMFTSMMRLM